MSLTLDDEIKIKQQFEENIKDVDSDDVEYASKKGNKAINKFGDNPPNALLKMWNDIKLMIGLITDYVKGKYTKTPWNVIASIVGAIVYFVSPVDVIPDFLPAVGYLDDAMVIKLALEFASDDLVKYSLWKTERENI